MSQNKLPKTDQSDKPSGEILLYQAVDGTVELDVRLERESIWLSQKQMALLFGKDTDTIGLHLRNIFKDGELVETATTEESSVVQQEGQRQVRRKVRFYNLDAIISVGYRVNSKRGTQFRIWATNVLRDHMIKGYSVNQNRLRDLNQAVRLIADTAQRRDLSGDEAKALLRVVEEYRRALSLLDDYDHQRVSKPKATGKLIYQLGYDEAYVLLTKCARSLTSPQSLGWRRARALRALWERSCRPLMAETYIPRWRRRLRTCSVTLKFKHGIWQRA